MVRISKVRKDPNRKRKPEPTLTVGIRPSVVKDLITVLSKFSWHKMELLQLGQKEHADRLLALNLFRESVAEELRKFENTKK